MDDTHPKIKEKLQRLMSARSGPERMLMASDMYESAKTISLLGLKKIHPEASDAELRKFLFIRLYKEDIPEAQLAQIFQKLSQ